MLLYVTMDTTISVYLYVYRFTYKFMCLCLCAGLSVVNYFS